MDVSKLKTLVGQEYQAHDDLGNYIGCFAPLYYVWRDLPRYALPECECDYFATALDGLLEAFDEVEGEVYDVLKPFDVVVLRLPMGMLHVGVYLGKNEFLHVERGSRVDITRFSRLSHRVFAILRRGSPASC